MASPGVTPSPTSYSRDELQGASWMTGGVLHGRALGNIFNHADGEDEVHLVPHKGKVLVFQSPRDPLTNKPDMSITMEITPQLKPILKTFARKYLPVHSE